MLEKYSETIKEQVSDGPQKEISGFFIYPGKLLTPKDYTSENIGATHPGFTHENRDLMRSAMITALILERDIQPH